MALDIAHRQRQMLARFVVWTKNGDMPIWRMVPFTVGDTLELSSMDWLVSACDGMLLTSLEHLDYGMWRAIRLDTAKLILYDYAGTQLFRIVGVEQCPLLGLELEDIDRHLGIPRPPSSTVERDNRQILALRHIRVVVWKRDGEPPVIHRVSFNDDNTLQLALHAPLEEDLDDWHLVQLWVWELADWEVVSTLNSFHVDAKYDSVLVKLPGVTCTPGFGRELWATEARDEQPEGFGEQPLLVTEEIMLQVHEAVPDFYDLALTTRSSRATLMDAKRRGDALGKDDILHAVVIPPTSVATGLTLRKRRRTGEGDGYEPPLPVRRRESVT